MTTYIQELNCYFYIRIDQATEINSHSELISDIIIKISKKSKMDIQDLQKVKKHSKKNEGRWTKKEQQVFLKGLNTHGKCWKKIKELLPSRTLTQIRSHAQKYLIRIKNQKYNSQDQYSDGNSYDAEVSYIPKIFKINRQKEDSQTPFCFQSNTLPENDADAKIIEEKSQEAKVQNQTKIKTQDMQRKSLFKEHVIEQINILEENFQKNEFPPILPMDWYSSGPSVFYQIMLYYQNQIYNNGNLFPLIDYQ